MYVRWLGIDGFKLLRDFELDFTRDGEPRMWTVLVGRNGLLERYVSTGATGAFRPWRPVTECVRLTE